jgi:hypothetical protein
MKKPCFQRVETEIEFYYRIEYVTIVWSYMTVVMQGAAIDSFFRCSLQIFVNYPLNRKKNAQKQVCK